MSKATHHIDSKTVKNLSGTLFVFVLGIMLGAGLEHAHENAKLLGVLGDQHPIRSKTSYEFINPLLAYDSPEAATEFNEYADLEEKLIEYIEEAKTSKNISRVSLYYRDLNYGRWVGINENEGYEPASMLKVMIMIAYLKEAEHNPTMLDRTFEYTKALSDALGNIPYQATSALVVGKRYSVRELITRMITNSDNGAKNILLENANPDVLSNTYSDLGVQDPSTSPVDYVISSKTYSLFLRVLYNATYLSRAMSEEALRFLSKAAYGDGIVAGIPPNIKVAQKFGEHVYVDASGQPTGYALSNCGIIYAPGHPYVLCIMTQGNEINTLAKVISRLSSLVYQTALQSKVN